MASQSHDITPQLNLTAVTIGVLTALKEEYAACKAILDPDQHGHEEHRTATSGDFVCWICHVQSRCKKYHVVAISMLHDMGNTAAAIAANILLQHCPVIRHLIMCGIAGAVPNLAKPDEHVRLGDIVVSDARGIIQYDRGKQRNPISMTMPKRHRTGVSPTSSAVFAGFEFRAHPIPPASALLQAVKRIHAEEEALCHATLVTGN